MPPDRSGEGARTLFARHWPGAVAACPDLRRRLLAAYGAPGRHYHDTRHLAEVLDHVARLLTGTPLPQAGRDAVVLAAWFHDAVYDGRPDDEERSADLAEETLPTCAVPTPLVAEVARLVRLTREHDPASDDLAGQVLCDADLAILAADRARYREYTGGVREEFAHVDEAAFRDGRAALLRALLEGPLFHTAAAREAWEAPARANVVRELAELGS